MSTKDPHIARLRDKLAEDLRLSGGMNLAIVMSAGEAEFLADGNMELVGSWVADAEAKLRNIQELHHAKHGEDENGAYVICDYDKTRWPCDTEMILKSDDGLSVVEQEES